MEACQAWMQEKARCGWSWLTKAPGGISWRGQIDEQSRGAGWVVWSLIDAYKDFDFYSEKDGELLEDFEQNKAMIWLLF